MLLELARRSHEAPASLDAQALDPLRAEVGEDAIDFAMVLVGFHHINRVADLLHVDPEAVPDALRRFDLVRRIGVRMGARLMGRMDLANRAYESSFQDEVARITPLLPAAERAGARQALAPFRSRPKVIEALRMALEERLDRSTLEPAVLSRVAEVCAQALPRDLSEATGFHPRPEDPVDAFAFVGTRYPARTTEAMIAALRRAGYDDEAILDLAIAVADANLWGRLARLFDLPAGLFAVETAADRRAAAG